MGLENINWIGSIVATVIAFAIGAFWYSPMAFAKAWQKGVGLSDEDMEGGNMAQIFGLAFVLMLLAAFAFSKFLGPDPSLQGGVCWGIVVGIFFASTLLGMHYLFERKPLNLWLINAGYNTVTFAVYGIVLGLWP